jgi:hypothetical protein
MPLERAPLHLNEDVPSAPLHLNEDVPSVRASGAR